LRRDVERFDVAVVGARCAGSPLAAAVTGLTLVAEDARIDAEFDVEAFGAPVGCSHGRTSKEWATPKAACD
jgi:hypothetical protein